MICPADIAAYHRLFHLDLSRRAGRARPQSRPAADAEFQAHPDRLQWTRHVNPPERRAVHPADRAYRDKDGELRFGPEPRQDFELEVGAFIGAAISSVCRSRLSEARHHIFGYCLLNDWSARAIQAWETVPAGPFQGKSFFTTISPWVVTGEALMPFHCPNFVRAAEDPKPLSYLYNAENEEEGGIDLRLEAYLLTPRMRPPALRRPALP